MTKNRVNIPMLIACIALCLVMITTHFMSGMLAKFVVTATASDNARVAKFVFDIDDGATQSIPFDFDDFKTPGAQKKVDIEVTNARASVLSEVDVQYYIEINSKGNLPLTFTLEKNNASSSGTYASGLSSGGGRTSTWGTMKANESATHSYTLTITWTASEKDPAYADEIDLIKMTIRSEQVD